MCVLFYSSCATFTVVINMAQTPCPLCINLLSQQVLFTSGNCRTVLHSFPGGVKVEGWVNKVVHRENTDETCEFMNKAKTHNRLSLHRARRARLLDKALYAERLVASCSCVLSDCNGEGDARAHTHTHTHTHTYTHTERERERERERENAQFYVLGRKLNNPRDKQVSQECLWPRTTCDVLFW